MINENLSSLSCDYLKGVGEKTVLHLARLNIYSVQDILFHLPFRYQDRTRVSSLASLKIGDHAVVQAKIISTYQPIGGKTRLICQLQDTTGKLHLRFFYVNASQKKMLNEGVEIRCFGEVRLGKFGLEMIHPEYKILTDEELPIEKTLTPIYATKEGLSQTMWLKLTNAALKLLQEGRFLTDILPATILTDFPSLKEALHYVHRPPADASVDCLMEGKHPAQKRMVFEELLAHRLSLLKLKKNFQTLKTNRLSPSQKLIPQFLQSLPFTLTHAQEKVVDEITKDLNRSFPMLRLVQGDVGSGKTVVAACAILQTIEQGFQAALLAPTEILAEQHFQQFQKWFNILNIPVAMLKSQMKAAEKRQNLTDIAEGKIKLIIGTHAIFQKEAQFANLACIIVDEQHRFGVEQRVLLRGKGIKNSLVPHQLMMSATPIPRTLAMSVYADLDYSQIDELPPGRTPIITTVIANTHREQVLQKIYEKCKEGHQAYWVCALISESESLNCEAAEKTAELLKTIFPSLKIGLIHGQMKSIEKEQLMLAFKQKELDLLVATTVIEVGVDVPNASLMVIENAERLGLSTLHQLRGRVGRGGIQSFCILMYQSPLSHLAKERLSVMRATTDGFKIAEKDLELRGPGEVLGTRQTGEISLRIADLIRDNHLLTQVEQAAKEIEQNFSDIIEPLIKRWLHNSIDYGQV